MLSLEFQHMDAGEIGRNRSLWQPIPRALALTESRSHRVAVIQRGLGGDTVTLFQPSNRFYRANGPYLYEGLRYFLYIGPGGGDTRLKHSLGIASKPPEVELEPLEFEDMATGEFRSLGSPVKKKPEPHPIEFQLPDVAGTASNPEPEEPAGKFSLAALLNLKQEIPEVPALPVIPMPVEILLTDADGRPMPKTAFKAQFPDGTVVSGNSDLAGLIRFPDNTQTGEIVLTLPELAKESASHG